MRARRGGFTLIEMAVAAFVLALGVVAVLTCIGSSARSTAVAAEYTTAAMLAQQHMSEVEAQVDQLVGGEQQGDFGDDHPGFAWTQQVETTDLTGLYRVTLTIAWPSGSSQRTAQFVTYEQTQTSTSAEVAQ